MSARSSRRSALALVAAMMFAAGCGKDDRAPTRPEADPAAITKLAATMARNVPTPAATRECTEQDLGGGATVTFRTLMQLGKQPLSDRPEEAEWINPHAMDVPAARVLLDDKATATARRQAAAELLAAKHWVAYKVDLVNAPMALGVKELKIGTVHTRVIRYDTTGAPTCVLVFNFQNDKAVSDKAIEISDRAAVDPAVAKILREDLTARWLELAPR